MFFDKKVGDFIKKGIWKSYRMGLRDSERLFNAKGGKMKTVKEVSMITGVSIRTLRYYDEIGLLRPTELTEAGYRLYDNKALEKLQEILFFRE